MSDPVVYYSANESFHVSVITNNNNETDCSYHDNINIWYSNEAGGDCSNISIEIEKNNDLAHQLQNNTSKNDTTRGIFNDSNIFYNTQYIQLWNMGGGILLASYMIYYLVNNNKKI